MTKLEYLTLKTGTVVTIKQSEGIVINRQIVPGKDNLVYVAISFNDIDIKKE